MKIQLEKTNRVNVRNALERMQQKQREAKQSEIEIKALIESIVGDDFDKYTWRIDSADCLFLEGTENAND